MYLELLDNTYRDRSIFLKSQVVFGNPSGTTKTNIFTKVLLYERLQRGDDLRGDLIFILRIGRDRKPRVRYFLSDIFDEYSKHIDGSILRVYIFGGEFYSMYIDAPSYSIEKEQLSLCREDALIVSYIGLPKRVNIRYISGLGIFGIYFLPYILLETDSP